MGWLNNSCLCLGAGRCCGVFCGSVLWGWFGQVMCCAGVLLCVLFFGGNLEKGLVLFLGFDLQG